MSNGNSRVEKYNKLAEGLPWWHSGYIIKI